RLETQYRHFIPRWLRHYLQELRAPGPLADGYDLGPLPGVSTKGWLLAAMDQSISCDLLWKLHRQEPMRLASDTEPRREAGRACHEQIVADPALKAAADALSDTVEATAFEQMKREIRAGLSAISENRDDNWVTRTARQRAPWLHVADGLFQI